MAGAWRALLVVGLAVMARVVHCQLSYETIAALAEQYFNQERRGQTLFRLLEAIPPPHWAPDIQRSPESSELLPTEIDSSKLPPSIRDLYLKAKFDLISNILRNF
ncbi:15 kDa protein B-like isoform X2 [Choloepus didactylus]|uniref:15 kDa protein B-like isoform X2 n=1 Tax=Choloepus didactylus TaxID=27675 RepID=UPI00189FEB0C|nr:15 kDa protein B-like isoform X2 [Choloepus didactylus]